MIGRDGQYAPVSFIPVYDQEDYNPGGSKANQAEARLVVDIVAQLLVAGQGSLLPRDIGIVTPYMGQA